MFSELNNLNLAKHVLTLIELKGLLLLSLLTFGLFETGIHAMQDNKIIM